MAFLVAVALPSEVRADGFVRQAKMEQAKIISVILDDSTSMIRDDSGKRKYNTRWVEADYAVKALASMMNEQDIFRLYVMGDYADGPVLELTISENGRKNRVKSQEVEDIEDRMSDIEHIGATWFTGVEKAQRDFMEKECAEKDCWIVILTDGRFTKPEEIGETELSKKLRQITEESNISVAYIPIGGDGAYVIEEDIKNRVIVPKEKDDVTKQVTEIANFIYKRVQMQIDDSTKLAKNQSKYLEKENDRIIIRFDIPLEQIITFIQHREESMLYTNFKNDEDLVSKAENPEIVKNDEAMISPEYLSLVSKNTFGGKMDRPKWNTSEKMDPAEVRYRLLEGAILIWKGNSNQYATNLSDKQDTKDEIIIPVDNGQALLSEIYYQPAVHVQYEYWQNGKPLEHVEECAAGQGDQGGAERCIEEGQLTVKLKLTDYNGRELQHTDSRLLYLEQFDVKLQPEDAEKAPVNLEQSSADRFQYTGVVEQGKYHINVTTSWHEVLISELEVQERRKELGLEVSAPDTLMVDDESGEGSIIRVIVREDGEIPAEEIQERISVTCTCNNEDLKVEKPKKGDNGVWLCRVFLADPERDRIDNKAIFHITAEREYDVGKKSFKEMEITRSIKTGPHKLTIALKEGENRVNALSCMFKGKKLSCDYKCDDVSLTNEQRKTMEVNVALKDGKDQELPVAVKGYDRGIFLKPSYKWWKLKDQSVSGTLEVEYQKQTELIHETFSFEVMVKPVPLILRKIALALVFIAALWIVACLIKIRTSWHIGRIHAYLCSDGGRIKTNLHLNRLGNLLVPWIRTAKLTYLNNKSSNYFLPDIKIKFRNSPDSEGLMICNDKDFTDRSCFEINELPIDRYNKVFSENMVFSVIDGDKYRQNLHF